MRSRWPIQQGLRFAGVLEGMGRYPLCFDGALNAACEGSKSAHISLHLSTEIQYWGVVRTIRLKMTIISWGSGTLQ